MTDQADHNQTGEDHDDPMPRTVQVRSGPSVVWDPVSGKGGLTFSTMANPKAVIHTTETKPEWGVPSYPYPPHVTVNLLEPGTVWQHVTGDKGSYAMKSASPQSPNYEAGPTYQVEHLGYASATPTAPDIWYESLARECVWFYRTKGVPLVFASPFEDGSAYGDWPGRMSQAEFAEFSGFCGHQHAPSPNAHWDPGKLDVLRLKAAIDELLDTTPEQPEGEEMILVEGAGGNGVTSMQRALNGWAESSGKDWKVATDGTWEKGSKLTERVKEYQRALNFTDSGQLDGLTASYLLRFDPPNL